MSDNYTQKISAGGNDGYTYTGSNYWNVTGTYLPVGPTYPGFFRFTNLPMAQGATINSAYLKVYTHQYGSSNSVTLKVRACDQDNAAAFPASNGTNTDPVNRPRTTAGVDFDFDGTRDTLRTSPDIKSVIQEVIDRPGWVGGNAIAIVLEEDGGTWANDLNPYEYNSSKAAELVINYTGISTYQKTCVAVARIINPARDVGIKIVKPTFDVKTEDDPSNMIFNSDYDTFKYFASGSLTVEMDTDDLAGMISYQHNLGYIPHVEVYSRLDDDSYWFPCPFAGAGATVFYGATFRVTSTHVYFYAESTGFFDPHDFHFRFFIFRNDLEF